MHPQEVAELLVGNDFKVDTLLRGKWMEDQGMWLKQADRKTEMTCMAPTWKAAVIRYDEIKTARFMGNKYSLLHVKFIYITNNAGWEEMYFFS